MFVSQRGSVRDHRIKNRVNEMKALWRKNDGSIWQLPQTLTARKSLDEPRFPWFT